ncbi:MAG: DUF1294 domain-containing protein [Eubacterium sp.]|nr:DUF1294 domain-containing protein [Eubacterium sp.]
MKSEFLLAYFIAINIIGIIINCADKHRAKRGKWRIKEATLWIIGLLGGAPCSYITMKIIRHKTKHKSFMIIMPLLALIQIVILFYFIFN